MYTDICRTDKILIDMYHTSPIDHACRTMITTVTQRILTIYHMYIDAQTYVEFMITYMYVSRCVPVEFIVGINYYIDQMSMCRYRFQNQWTN